ncbi:acyltransferase [Sinomonas mesophila]|uniref:acyltransferase n=1 Tax=Sinomonas mesophila TaxID=1531955 RepID=UPI002481D785|nr:acyltransferase [Sinomonas mesophila]
MTGTHDIGPSDRRASEPTRYSPVRIGKGAWLGAGVVVQPGVSIGEGCVVAAGAVVTKDLDPNGLYAGVPAKLVRSLAGEPEGTIPAVRPRLLGARPALPTPD